MADLIALHRAVRPRWEDYEVDWDKHETVSVMAISMLVMGAFSIQVWAVVIEHCDQGVLTWPRLFGEICGLLPTISFVHMHRCRAERGRRRISGGTIGSSSPSRQAGAGLCRRVLVCCVVIPWGDDHDLAICVRSRADQVG
jgi:hypothetical protein